MKCKHDAELDEATCKICEHEIKIKIPLYTEFATITVHKVMPGDNVIREEVVNKGGVRLEIRNCAVDMTKTEVLRLIGLLQRAVE